MTKLEEKLNEFYKFENERFYQIVDYIKKDNDFNDYDLVDHLFELLEWLNENMY
jgi:hypothetical protein